ncbi:hypothetical protein J3F83DRAFT_738271 [Trichoderma novae-zelandiae]
MKRQISARWQWLHGKRLSGRKSSKFFLFLFLLLLLLLLHTCVSISAGGEICRVMLTMGSYQCLIGSCRSASSAMTPLAPLLSWLVQCSRDASILLLAGDAKPRQNAPWRA